MLMLLSWRPGRTKRNVSLPAFGRFNANKQQTQRISCGPCKRVRKSLALQLPIPVIVLGNFPSGAKGRRIESCIAHHVSAACLGGRLATARQAFFDFVKPVRYLAGLELVSSLQSLPCCRYWIYQFLGAEESTVTVPGEL